LFSFFIKLKIVSLSFIKAFAARENISNPGREKTPARAL
jgi:hypothetical protein